MFPGFALVFRNGGPRKTTGNQIAKPSKAMGEPRKTLGAQSHKTTIGKQQNREKQRKPHVKQIKLCDNQGTIGTQTKKGSHKKIQGKP